MQKYLFGPKKLPGQLSRNRPLGPVSRKFRELLGPEKLFCVCRIYIQDQSFNNFDNDTMKLSVDEAKSTGL